VCWKPRSSCWSFHLLREEFLSAPIHSPLSGLPYRSFNRCFLYDHFSIEEIERKWLEFLDKYAITDKESWLYQMYERREVGCATYHANKCYLGLRSYQHSESLHSRIQFNLDRKMTLVEL
jgi:hypothetical protein